MAGFKYTMGYQARYRPSQAFIRSALMRSVAAIGMATVATIASAQTAPNDPASHESSAQAGGAIDDIVVVAQRVRQNLQDVPISVFAAKSDTLEKKGITSTRDLSQLTPGLVGQVAEGFVLPHLRGIGTTSDTVGVGSPIAIYVDGVFINSPIGSIFSLASIEQIEVYKGPQGTLFGRNATGGLIQVLTKDPSHEFGGKVSGSVDNYATFGSDLYLTGGVSDNVAADLSVHYSNQINGWGTNLRLNKEIYKGEEISVRNKWLWTPSSQDKITVALDYSHTNDTYGVLDYIPGFIPFDYGLSGEPINKGSPWNAYEVVQPTHVMSQGGGSLTVRHLFDFATLTSTSAYRDLSSRKVFSFSSPPYDITGIIGARESQITQELQLSSAAGAGFKWTLGAFYLHAIDKQNPYINGQHGTPAVPGGAFGFPPLAPGIAPELGAGIFGGVTTADQKTNSGAIYGQISKELLPRTTFTVGGRYTIEHSQIAGVDAVLGVVPSHHASFKEPTWRFSVDHKLTDATLLYASYNRGFKAGTFNTDLPAVAATKPEKLDAYEIGLKTSQFDRRLRLNLSGFYYNYSNIVESFSTSVNNRVVLQSTNGPKAESYGVDLDITAKPTSRFQVDFSIEALKSKFTVFPGASIVTAAAQGAVATIRDASGNQLPVAPELTTDLTANYDMPTSFGTVSLNSTWQHNSGWFAGIDNTFKQNPFESVSAFLSWTSLDKDWRVAVWGKNLTNAAVFTYSTTAAPFGFLANYGPPRTFGVRIDRNF